MFLEFAKIAENIHDDEGRASLESKNALQRLPRHPPTSHPHCGTFVREADGWSGRVGVQREKRGRNISNERRCE